MSQNKIISLLSFGIMLVTLLLILGFYMPAPTLNEDAPLVFNLPSSAKEAIKLLHTAAESRYKPLALQRPVPANSGFFKVPEDLRARVDFWKRIFIEMYSFEALVHDSYDLNLIYGFVDLRDEPGADPFSHTSMQSAARRVLNRYKEHLNLLTTEEFDPASLAGERKRLYMLLQKSGGAAANRGAGDRLRIQRGLRSSLRHSIIRSGRYIHIYRKMFRAYGLPEELALLPHLESSFRHEARSRAGAVGIWQLTKHAVHGMLHINSTVDERIDPWRSAEVAAELLAENHRLLGSWDLAITAYNQGVGSLRSAIAKVGSRNIEEIISRYRSRSFKFVGRNFYCVFLAITEIVKEYELHYGDLPIDPEVLVKRHQLEKPTSLRSICKELGIKPQQLAPLNPALQRPAFTTATLLPRGMYLNLPYGIHSSS